MRVYTVLQERQLFFNERNPVRHMDKQMNRCMCYAIICICSYSLILILGCAAYNYLAQLNAVVDSGSTHWVMIDLLNLILNCQLYSNTLFVVETQTHLSKR